MIKQKNELGNDIVNFNRTKTGRVVKADVGFLLDEMEVLYSDRKDKLLLKRLEEFKIILKRQMK